MEDNYKVGLSSACFYPMETFESVRYAYALGFRSIEIFINAPSELDESYINQIEAFVKSNDIKITSIHPYTSGYENIMFFSDYYRRSEDATSYYENYFRCAKQLCADYVIFHGDNNNSKFIGFDRYCTVYDMLQKRAGKYGVTLTHENISRARSGSPQFIKELIEHMNGDIKFTFDLKQAMRANENPFEMIDAMGERIAHVHINDWDNGCKLPFYGAVALDKIYDKLLSKGYNGKYIIEVYNENFSSDEQIKDSAKRLNNMLVKY